MHAALETIVTLQGRRTSSTGMEAVQDALGPATQRDRTYSEVSKVAILVVNGFDRGSQWGSFDIAEPDRFPWIAICLRQIERHTANVDYSVEVWDSSRLAAHAAAMARHQHVNVHREHQVRRDARRRLRSALSSQRGDGTCNDSVCRSVRGRTWVRA
jgi:hypothetical protein